MAVVFKLFNGSAHEAERAIMLWLGRVSYPEFKAIQRDTSFIFGFLTGWEGEAVLIVYRDGSILFKAIKCLVSYSNTRNRSEN